VQAVKSRSKDIAAAIIYMFFFGAVFIKIYPELPSN
jgi:uncharacterized membrane protein YadS